MKIKISDFLKYKLDENLNQVRKYLKSENRESVEDEAGFIDIKNALKNNPNYLLMAIKFYNATVPKDKIIEFFNKIKKYKQLLKNNNIDITNSFNKLEKFGKEEDMFGLDYKDIFESISDKVEKAIIDNDKKKFASKFFSNKYKYLIDEKTVNLLDKIRDILGTSDHKAIQGMITSKLAAYKTSDELNKALRGIIKQLDSGGILKTIKENNIDIVYDDEDVIIVDVKTYEEMCAIGSQKWCIVRDEYYFDEYVSFPNKQYVIFDLTKDTIDPYYMLGVTIKHDGSVEAAHDMEDEEINKDVYGKWLKYLKPMDRDEIENNIQTIIQAIDYDSPKKFKEFFGKDVSNGRLKDPYSLFVLALQKDSFRVIEYIMKNLDTDDREYKLVRRVFSIRAIVKENFEIFKVALEQYYRLGHKVTFNDINTMLFNIKKEKTTEPEKYIKHILDNYEIDYTESGHNNASYILTRALHMKAYELYKVLFNDKGINELLDENDRDFFQKQLDEYEKAK